MTTDLVLDLGYLFISLHTRKPTSELQDHHEITLQGYQRIGVPRFGGWLADALDPDNVFYNAHPIMFPTITGEGEQVATYFGIGLRAEGSGTLLIPGQITPAIVLRAGVAPCLSSVTIEGSL